jgi:quercetin dioxygenase-like cupin family protein
LRVHRLRKKWVAVFVGVAVVGTFAAVALATTPVSFTSLPVVTANLDNSVQLNSDRVKFQTKDPTFVRVAKITIAEGGNSGWHHHPGMVIVAVLSGTVKFTNSDCSSTTHAAGTAFVEGGDDPGLAESVGGEAVVYATFIAPQTPVPVPPPLNSSYRINDPAPACAG